MLSRSVVFGLLALLATVFALPTHHGAISRRAITAAAPPRLVAYIQTFHDTSGNPLSLLPLLDEQTGVTHVYLSAVHLNENPGDINLNDDNPNATLWDQMWSDAARLQQGGIKVMMMLGGAAQGSYQRLAGDDASFHAYYDPLLATLRHHNIDGLDLDIEENVDVSVPLRLLRQLHSDMGPDFLLTMAPVASALTPTGPGLSGFSYADLDSQATEPSRPNGKLVNWYNAQFYNGWGDASSATNYNTVVERGGWSPDRVVMGVLDNPHDGGSGFVDIRTLTSVIQQLKTNYDTFGCAVGWEYWDAGGADGYSLPWQWVKDVGMAVFGTVQKDLVRNVTVDEGLEPPSPWPTVTRELVGLGGGWGEVVKALNQTDGDEEKAKGLLGLGNLLGAVGGLLDV